MRIHWLQHVAHEGLGNIAPWLAARGISPVRTALYAGDALPSLDGFDALIVMGGPMNVDEHLAHPWLTDEKSLIRAAIDAGRPMLGICLGAQLIARACGAEVRRNPHTEIGWFEVERTPAGRAHPYFADFPDPFLPFHWHGDRFDPPRGVDTLLCSQACGQQAFALGTQVLGLQFHLEITADDLTAWLAEDTPTPAEWVQTAAEMHATPATFAAAQGLMARLLERWLD